MKTKIWAIFLMILCTIILSIAQIFWKLGADKLSWNIIKLITNFDLIMGFILYGVSGLLFIIALKGGELTVIHPMISLSLIGVAILSPLIIPGDIMNPMKWFGTITIIFGVFLIGYGNWKVHKK